MDGKISTMMENRSTWRPRPAKTNRSYFKKPLQEQYGGISSAFVDAALELSLLMMDMPYWVIEEWLTGGFEQQSMETNRFLRELPITDQEEKKAMLKAHYSQQHESRNENTTTEAKKSTQPARHHVHWTLAEG